MDNVEIRITGTLLSRKPREESLLITLLTVVVTLFASLLCWKSPYLIQRFSANQHQVLGEQEYWRLFTAMAIHADLTHFISNAILLAVFTYLLYGYFGFWLYPIALLSLGSLTNYLSLLTYPESIHLIGTSGLVYLMAGFWLTIYVLVERTRSLKRRILIAVGIALIVLVPSSLSPRVSYRTHAIGCTIGLVAALAYFHTKKEKIRFLETLQTERIDE